MKKEIHYIIQEIFVETCQQKRGENLSLIHISEPTRLGMISYAVFCLKKKNRSLMKPEALSSYRTE